VPAVAASIREGYLGPVFKRYLLVICAIDNNMQGLEFGNITPNGDGWNMQYFRGRRTLTLKMVRGIRKRQVKLGVVFQ